MTDRPEAQIEQQVEKAKTVLELFHGDALEFEDERQAVAFCHAIELIEDAQAGKLSDDPSLREKDLESIRRSREAREEGYRAATLLGHDREQRENGDRPSLFERARSILNV